MLPSSTTCDKGVQAAVYERGNVHFDPSIMCHDGVGLTECYHIHCLTITCIGHAGCCMFFVDLLSCDCHMHWQHWLLLLVVDLHLSCAEASDGVYA